MKFISSLLLEAAVFVVAMLVFGVAFPILETGGVAMGLTASVLLYSLVGTVATVILAVVLGGGGAIVGALLGDGKESVELGGCLGLVPAIILAYLFHWWWLYSLPQWFAWYPSFTVWQSLGIVIVSSTLSIIANTNTNKSKE